MSSGDLAADDPGLFPGPTRPAVPPEMAAAAEQWRALAPALSARRRMRVSHNGGRTYPRERALTADPPPYPAAVYVYDEHGGAGMLAADFDTKRAIAHGAADGAERVRADAAAFAALIRSCGGRGFGDISPNGGRHAYVLWAAPVPYTEMRRVVLALAARYPSLDPSPMLGRPQGVIRPPGSRHRGGGLQLLTSPLADARRCVRAPNGPAVWKRLCVALDSELRALDGPPAGADDEERAPAGVRARLDEAGLPWLPRRGGRLPRLKAALELAAITGGYDTGRYASRSEARQAVLDSAAARGWRLAEVAARMDSGEWQGLAGFYAKYSPQGRVRQLAKEWKKAVTFVRGSKTGRDCTTRENHQAPPGYFGAARRDLDHAAEDPAGPDLLDEFQKIRMWNNGIRAGEESGRWEGKHGLSVRMLLRALGAAAQMTGETGSMVVEWGSRSLALQAGLDRSTVSRILRELDAEPDDIRVIEILQTRRGWRGDLIMLCSPPCYAEAAAWRRWRPGRIGIHPALLELGGPATVLVYEQLTTAPARATELARLTRLSATAVSEALAALAGEAAAVRGPGGWQRGPADLDQLADRLGVPARLAAITARHQAERQQWRACLRLSPTPPVRPARSPGSPARSPRQETLQPAAARAPPPSAAAADEITAAAIAILENTLGPIEIIAA